MPRPAIIVNRVCKSFRRDQPVLKELSLRLEHAEMVALIGLSESGKSSFIRLISGRESMNPRGDGEHGAGMAGTTSSYPAADLAMSRRAGPAGC